MADLHVVSINCKLTEIRDIIFKYTEIKLTIKMLSDIKRSGGFTIKDVPEEKIREFLKELCFKYAALAGVVFGDDEGDLPLNYSRNPFDVEITSND